MMTGDIPKKGAVCPDTAHVCPYYIKNIPMVYDNPYFALYRHEGSENRGCILIGGFTLFHESEEPSQLYTRA